MPQRQNYPYDQQRQTLSPTAANCNSASRLGRNNLSASFNFNARNNPTNRNAPRQAVAVYQPSAARQPTSRQPYQSNLPSRGYHKNNEKRVYQVNDEEADPHLEGFYTILEQESEEMQYSNKGFDEVDANFVCIETSCGKCGAPFSSKSRLHKYLKDGCVISLQHSLLGAPSPSSPISIITSSSVLPAMSLGLAF